MKIIHITDPHVRPEGDTIYGVDAGSRFATVLGDVVLRHGDADLIAVTGDLTHHGEPSAYRRLAGLLDGLAIPVRLMLGNHDLRGNFRAAFPEHPVDDAGFVQCVLDAPGRIGRLIFLDTHEPDRRAASRPSPSRRLRAATPTRVSRPFWRSARRCRGLASCLSIRRTGTVPVWPSPKPRKPGRVGGR